MHQIEDQAKILIVEDESIIGHDLALHIRSFGYQIIGPLTTGEEAMEIAEKEHPDLVLMDIVLAGQIDGIQAAERMRTSWGIPVVFLTGYGDENTLARAKSALPLGYLLKPYSGPNLKVTLDMALYAAKAETDRRRAEEGLKRLEWMISKASFRKPDNRTASSLFALQPYGDLTTLNSTRLILDSVGREALEDIISDYLELLDTSATVYEKNGDFALGICSSGWCRFLDAASRELCHTPDNREALASGQWLCHEACWGKASKVAIQTGQPVDVECPGGLRLFAVPIFAGHEVVGAMNFGYGDPPTAEVKLQELAKTFQISVDRLRKQAATYESRPPFVIEQAKSRTIKSAKLIGLMVEGKQNAAALQDSEAKARALLNTPVDAVFLIDPDGRILDLNETGAQRLGGSPRNLLGKNINQLVPSEVAFYRKIKVREGVISKESVRFEDQRQGLWNDIVLSPILDQHGQVTQLAIWARDITDRKRMEETLRRTEAELREAHSQLEKRVEERTAELRQEIVERQRIEADLKESEKRYRLITEALTDYIYKVHVDNPWHIYSEHSPASVAVTGYTREELTADYYLWISMVHQEDRDMVRRWSDDILGGTDPGSIEHRLIRKDGQTRWVSNTPVLHFDQTNRLIYYDGLIRDITERKQAEEILKKSEEKFSVAFHSSPIALSISSMETGRIIDVNEAFTKISGYDRDQLLGRSIVDFHIWGGGRYQDVLEPFLIEYGRINDFEYEFTRRSGEKAFGRLSAVLTDIADEICIMGMVEDITASKQAETALRESYHLLEKRVEDRTAELKAANDSLKWEVSERQLAEKALRESEERFKLVIEGSQIGYWDWNIPAGVVYRNNAWAEMLGYQPEQFDPAARFWAKLLHPDDLSSILIAMADHLEGRSLRYKIEYRILANNGRYRWILSQGRIMERDQDGRPQRVCGTNTDISYIKLAEATLRESEQQYRTIFEVIPDSVIIFRLDNGRCLHANNYFCQVSGYSWEEALGRTPMELDLYADKADRDKMINFRKQFGELTNYEVKLKIKSGEVLDTLISTVSLPFEGHECLMCVVTDITKRKKMELELHEAKEQAEAATAAKSRFLANMSHEIRTPLNGVLGMLQLIQDTVLNEEQRSFIETAIASGIILKNLINDILDFSKIEAGKIELHQEPISLAEILRSVTAMFTSQADIKRINLHYGLSENVPETLLADGARIRQILINLVGNAIKFTPKGEIRIVVQAAETQMDSDEVMLNFSVSDTGIGIPQEQADRIFEAFSQVTTSYTRTYEGTGLGLSIVKSLIGLMGGHIRVESTVGKGTTFLFSLRVKRAAKTVRAPAITERTVAAPGDDGPLNVLLVEDNPVNQLLAKKMLERLGHTVTTAANGEIALTLLRLDRFDLVIMDVQMPVMDGLEATKLIRKDKSGAFNPNVPIIAMTAHALKGEGAKFLEVGMNDYVPKPIDKLELVTAISRVLPKC